MRILTVRQPWAWAIIHAGKNVENRSSNIAGGWRGPVAIHAGKAPFNPEGLLAAALHRILGWVPGADRIIYGHILGVVDLVDVDAPHPRCSRCSPWAFEDQWHLVLANPRPLPEPIPHKGALGLRELPADVAQRIEQQLSAFASSRGGTL